VGDAFALDAEISQQVIVELLQPLDVAAEA
jgi:hypothetical protein